MSDSRPAQMPPEPWALAEEARRDAMRASTPAERLELLEEIVELAFSAQELNPKLRGKPASKSI